MFLRLNRRQASERQDCDLIIDAIPRGAPYIREGKSPRINVSYLSDSNLDAFRDALIGNSSVSQEVREQIRSAWLHEQMFVAYQDAEVIIVSERTYPQFSAVRRLYTDVGNAREQVAVSYSRLVSGLQELAEPNGTVQHVSPGPILGGGGTGG